MFLNTNILSHHLGIIYYNIFPKNFVGCPTRRQPTGIAKFTLFVRTNQRFRNYFFEPLFLEIIIPDNAATTAAESATTVPVGIPLPEPLSAATSP